MQKINGSDNSLSMTGTVEIDVIDDVSVVDSDVFIVVVATVVFE